MSVKEAQLRSRLLGLMSGQKMLWVHNLPWLLSAISSFHTESKDDEPNVDKCVNIFFDVLQVAPEMSVFGLVMEALLELGLVRDQHVVVDSLDSENEKKDMKVTIFDDSSKNEYLVQLVRTLVLRCFHSEKRLLVTWATQTLARPAIAQVMQNVVKPSPNATASTNDMMDHGKTCLCPAVSASSSTARTSVSEFDSLVDTLHEAPQKNRSILHQLQQLLVASEDKDLLFVRLALLRMEFLIYEGFLRGLFSASIINLDFFANGYPPLPLQKILFEDIEEKNLCAFVLGNKGKVPSCSLNFGCVQWLQRTFWQLHCTQSIRSQQSSYHCGCHVNSTFLCSVRTCRILPRLFLALGGAFRKSQESLRPLWFVWLVSLTGLAEPMKVGFSVASLCKIAGQDPFLSQNSRFALRLFVICELEKHLDVNTYDDVLSSFCRWIASQHLPSEAKSPNDCYEIRDVLAKLLIGVPMCVFASADATLSQLLPWLRMIFPTVALALETRLSSIRRL